MFGIRSNHSEKSAGTAAPDSGRGIAEQVTLTRAAGSGDWILDISPNLDLLEVARVLGVVQNQAIELMQQQLSVPSPLNAVPPPVVDQSITDTVEF